MKAKNLFFKECHVAGRKYYDADLIWQSLKVGDSVKLVRDSDNKFDQYAVAVVYEQINTDSSQTERFVLGYIPAKENYEIATLLDADWLDIWNCTISKLDNTTYYDDQIHITIRIKNKE